MVSYLLYDRIVQDIGQLYYSVWKYKKVKKSTNLAPLSF